MPEILHATVGEAFRAFSVRIGAPSFKTVNPPAMPVSGDSVGSGRLPARSHWQGGGSFLEVGTRRVPLIALRG